MNVEGEARPAPFVQGFRREKKNRLRPFLLSFQNAVFRLISARKMKTTARFLRPSPDSDPWPANMKTGLLCEKSSVNQLIPTGLVTLRRKMNEKCLHQKTFSKSIILYSFDRHAALVKARLSCHSQSITHKKPAKTGIFIRSRPQLGENRLLIA